MELDTSLRCLCAVSGPSGRVGAVAAAATELLKPLVDEVSRDKLNNVLGVRRCGKVGANAVLLDAHLDEIGFVVTGHEEGFLRFSTVAPRSSLLGGRSNQKDSGQLQFEA